MATLESYKIQGISASHSVSDYTDCDQFNLHFHNSCELYCLVSGNVNFIVEGQTYSLMPGSMMLMRSAESHRAVVMAGAPYERYVVSFRPEVLLERGLSNELMRPYLARGLGERNLYQPEQFVGIEPIGMLRQTFAACAVMEPESALLSGLSALLCATNTVFARGMALSGPREEKNTGRELVDYINEHLTEDLSLSILSERVHMSASQINRVFRHYTGTSVYHYIVTKRLIAAQERIMAGESAISASQRCGFHDYSSFFRLYKKQMMAAPTDCKTKR